MERQLSVWRVMRRICTVILVFILLVACSAQVHAEGEDTAGEDVLTAMAEDTVEETGLTEENFAAVAAQLSAVARADGRSSADRMIYSAFSEAAALQVSEAAPVTAAAESSVNVIVVPETKAHVSFAKLLPFLLAAAAAGILLGTAVHRKAMRGTVYKPMCADTARRNPYADYGMVRTYR